MKKINIIITTLIACMMLPSCSLDEKVYTSVEMGTYMTDAKEAESVLLGVYREMNRDGIYGLNLSMLFQMPTDESKVEGSSTVGARQQASNAFTTTDSYVQNTWATLYTGIYCANSFLEGIEIHKGDYSEQDQKKAEIYIAEAKVLRALYYFELVRWYGYVPLMKNTAQSALHPSQFKQNTPVEVYEFIEQDLKDAIEVLPYASEDAVRGKNDFRISKGGALGLLTKVYATWAGYPVLDSSKWALAKSTAETLINSGKHGLLANYDDLWKNCANNVWDPKESLLEISFYSPQSTNESSGRVGKWNGVAAANGSIKGNYNFALYKVNPTFIMNWKDYDKDLRWGISYADYKYTVATGKTVLATAKVNGVTTDITFPMAMDENYENWDMGWRKTYCYTLTPKKWDIELYVKDENQLADNNYSNVNWYLLRYADVLLLYAEALNEVNQGPTAEAYEAVNMIRRRGFGFDQTSQSASADLPAGMSYEEFRQAIMDERSYELAFEGHRRQDLVRWGIYYETVQQTYRDYMEWHEMGPDYYVGAQYTFKNKNELLPIPQREMDLCEQFVQNQGWK